MFTLISSFFNTYLRFSYVFRSRNEADLYAVTFIEFAMLSWVFLVENMMQHKKQLKFACTRFRPHFMLSSVNDQHSLSIPFVLLALPPTQILIS